LALATGESVGVA